ncbi:MAG: preprotein translocase subunit YajC [bacterium]
MHSLNTMSGMVLAMASPGGAGGTGGGNPMVMIVYMAIIFGLFYFLMIRPQMRKEKDRRKMIEAVKTGDRVLFCGGMIGTVANVKDGVFTIKIGDTTKVEVARGAVYRLLSKDETPGDDVEKK